MRSTLLFLFLSFFCYHSNAQPIDACPDPGTAELESTCGSACVLCDLNGYMGTNDGTGLGEAPPGFCAAGLHNTQWIGFVAGSVNLTIEISVFNCTVVDEGLQIGIYNTTDCMNYTSVSNCDNEVPPGTSQTFTNTVPLVPGGIYFLVIDGFNGDICDFSVAVTSGSATAPTVDLIAPVISAPSEGCPGEAVQVSTPLVTGAGAYYWTLDGNEAGGDNIADIVLPTDEGTYDLCVTPYNPCFDGIESCTTIDVVAPAINVWEEATICDGDVYSYSGNDFTEEGQYFFTVIIPNECPDVVQLDLTVDPIDETVLDITLCPGLGYSLDGFTYYDAGTYDAVLTGSNGCDSLVELNLMYEGTDQTTIFFEEICDGEFYEIGGDQLTETGSYFYIFQDEFGCDSLVDMDLLVFPADDILVQETICDGESYSFYGADYSTEGTYTVATQTVNGCPIEAVLELVVDPGESTTIDASICDGQSYTVGSNVYTTTGTFVNNFMAADGCDSTITLNLTVVQTLTQIQETTICIGDTVFVDSQPYFASGTYDNNYTSTEGCDSTYQLVLTVLQDVVMNINPSICAGTSFDIGAESFNTTGMYEVMFDAANGCDSIVMVDLVVENQLMGNSALSLCDGESITVQGQVLDASGMYNFPYTTAEGCDSLHQLNLTIEPPVTTTINPAICSGTSYQIGNESFDMSGTYFVTLITTDGCDSTVQVNLVVEPQLMGSSALSLCDGESITVQGQLLDMSGMYSFPYTTAEGCDSLHQLNLTIEPPITTTINPVICSGSTYQIGNESFDIPGTYMVTLMSVDGCDSLVTVNLSFSDMVITPLNESICEGDTTYITSIPYFSTGNYEESLVTDNGCDSIVQLALVVIPNTSETLTPVLCDGETFDIDGMVFDATGVYNYTIPSAAGCDSVITVNLTIDPPIINIIDADICTGQEYQVANQFFDIAGTYFVTVPAQNGCDSLIQLNLTVSSVLIEASSQTICEGDSVTIGTSVYSTTGNYEDSFVTPEGCDSLYQLDLTVIPTVFGTVSPTICDGETYDIGMSMLDVSGVYEEILVSAAGCDSIVTINLTVAPNPEVMIEASICDNGSYTVGDTTLTQEGIHTIVLMSQVGCDSTVTLNLIVTDFYETNLDITLCEGEDYTVGMQTYNATGVYQDMFIAQDGCDSIVNLDLLVNPLLNSTVDAVICDGESYEIAGVSYSTAGTYQETIPSLVTGCDSTITLNLVVNPVFEITLMETICDGESVQIGDSIYVTAGNYQNLFSTENGCDSLVLLELQVTPIPETFLSANICEGDTYEVGTSVYTNQGMYTDTLTSALNCDSIVYLDLIVDPILETMLDIAICEGQVYEVGGQNFDETGSFTVALVSAVTGCDSIVYLDLLVNPNPETFLNESICSDESYEVGSESFNVSGDYEVVLSSAAGCDSTVFLTLVVAPCALSIDYLSLAANCNGSPTGSITFSMTVGTPPYTYAWTGAGSGLSDNGTINGNFVDVDIVDLPADTYTVTVTDANNVVIEINQAVTQPTALLIDATATLYGNFEVSCEGASDGQLAATASGGTPPYSYTWSTASSGANISSLPTGTYQLTVTDANGCQQSLETSLSAPSNISAEIQTAEPECFGESDGHIEVSGVQGGNEPYLYAIDGGFYSTDNVFTQLSAGSYQVSVQDAFGCEYSDQVLVTEPDQLIVDLGDEILMEYGEVVNLEAITNRPVVSYEWAGGALKNCDGTEDTNCFDPIIASAESTVYNVLVRDENGCTAEDQVRVIVAKTRNVYIPSAFSPNDDGVNDLFYIFGGVGVEKVKSFVIFNRWGESLYEAYDFDPGNSNFGWDGKFRGQVLNAGVYVYMIEVDFLDGETIIYSGETVLIF